MNARTRRPTATRRAGASPALDSLEARVVLSDLSIGQVVALSPTQVRVSYSVDGTMPVGSSFQLAIRRSATSAVDASSALGTASLGIADLSAGSHTSTITLASPLAINPSLPYVTAEATPGASGIDDQAGNNSGSFRIWTIAAVVHGYSTTGQFPGWVTTMSNDLKAQGYDAAIPFDWALASALPAPFVTPGVASSLVSQVTTAAGKLSGLQSNDMVDVHLIGQSRGGPVITQAAAQLPSGESSPIGRGYLKLTFLDAHPSDWNSSGPKYVSFSDGPIGRLAQRVYKIFETWNNDPALTVSANVDRVEVFYQHISVTNTKNGDIYESIVNDWGSVPLTLKAPGQTSASYYDLTSTAGSHFGVVGVYSKQVVPTLRTGAAVPIAPNAAPTKAPSGDGAAPGTAGSGAGSYEFRVLTAPRLGKAKAATARTILQQTDLLNQALNARKYSTASKLLNRLTVYTAAQRGRTIGADAADQLIGLYVQVRLVALPPFSTLTSWVFGTIR
ncbi:MAG: hypothetical protein U0800_17630 [Isosphaeraceae bacterium]